MKNMKKTRNLVLSVLLALTMITGMIQPLMAMAEDLPATVTTTETQSGDEATTQPQAGTEAQTGTETANPPTSGESAGVTESTTENVTEGTESGSPASTEGAENATGNTAQADETTGGVTPGTIALLGAPTGIQRAPMELSNVVKSISFVNTGMAPIQLLRVDKNGTGTAYLKMDLDFTNYDLVPGDYFVVEFPQQFTLKNESIEVKDGTDDSITLGTLETVANESGGGTLKFTFTEDVKDRKNVFGQYLFHSKLTDTEGKHSYDLTVSGGQIINTGEIELKITPATLSNVTKEVLYKNGYSNAKQPVFEYHIRINREQRNLGNVTIEDSIKDSGRIVQFIRDSFVLQKVTYGDKEVGDGYGVVRTNAENIELIPGQNIHFYNNDTKFVLAIPNVGTDSYYLAYRTNHYNDAAIVSNEAIIYDDGMRLQPYEAVVKVDRDGKPTGEIHPFNTRYLGHTRGISASSADFHAFRSDVREKLVIQKLDKDTHAFLKGAQFKVYKDSNATIEVFPDEVFTTDEKGTVVVSGLKLYTAAERNIYYVKEFKAPDGYKLSDKIETVRIVPNGTYLTFYNEKIPAETITLTAKKIWITNGDTATPQVAKFRVIQLLADGSTQIVAGTERSINGNAEQSWILPAKDASGNVYQYLIEEFDIPSGYTVSSHTDQGTVTFTNMRQVQPVQPPSGGGGTGGSSSGNTVQPPSGGGGTGGSSSGGGSGSATPSSNDSASNTAHSEIIVDATTQLKESNSDANSASKDSSTNSMIAGAQRGEKIANIASAPKTGAYASTMTAGNFLLSGLLVAATVSILLIEYTKKQKVK